MTFFRVMLQLFMFTLFYLLFALCLQKVLFNPVVVPCPDGPQFYPGWKNPPEMGVHQYWIMRLPFIYCGKENLFY